MVTRNDISTRLNRSQFLFLANETTPLGAIVVVPSAIIPDENAVFVCAVIVGLVVSPVREDDCRVVGRPHEFALIGDVIRADPAFGQFFVF